ncbi:MAG: hypothetical protein RIE08_16910 [Acidimicrobiales bacterium]
MKDSTTSCAAVVVLTLLATSCGSGDPTADHMDWGPLAVYDSGEDGNAAGLEGVLRIDAACTYLEAHEVGPVEVLLLWPDEGVEWNEESGTVRFETREGEAVTLRDGDLVAFAGAGSTSDLADERTRWIAAPQPSCDQDTVWYIAPRVVVLSPDSRDETSSARRDVSDSGSPSIAEVDG